MELHLTPRLKQLPAQAAAACERYVDRLPASPELRSELLADSPSPAVSSVPAEGIEIPSAMIELQTRLAGRDAKDKDAPDQNQRATPGGATYASVAGRFTMAYGNPQVDGQPLLQRRDDGTVRVDTGPEPQRESMVPRQWPPHVISGWIRNTWRRMRGRPPVPETWDTLHDGPDAEGKWHPAGS
ncbi:MAG: glucan biosynthesis glucosyltransferase H, partial [Cupriavidus sp.]|nr:glucan biosynthesis glucosyltransferase H [Cupriavidus sp.]